MDLISMNKSINIRFSEHPFSAYKTLNTLVILLLTLSFLCARSSIAYAGSPEIDSLQGLLRQNQDPAERITTLYALGKAYYSSSDYRSALDTDRKLIELIRTSGSREDSAKAFRHIALVMMEMSWYDESLNYLMIAQQLYGQLGDSARQATCLMNIGIVHDLMGNRPMSLSYYDKALNYFLRLKDESGIANCKLNIGIILTKQKKYQTACDHFLEAAGIYKKTGNLNYLAASYINLGLAYKNLKDFDLAMDYHKKSFDIYTQLNDKYHICFYHLNMGELLLQLDRPGEAKKHLDEARELAEEMGVMELSARAYEFLSDYHSKTRNFESAYHMLLKSKTINDSILNAETVEKVSQIQYHYEITRRENEKVQLQQENIQQELQLTHRTSIMYILAGLLLVIAVLVVILVLWNRSKHRANIELEAKNRLILSQKDELVKLNASKDKFLSILAHDIKNPLGAILGISDILNSDYPDLKEGERRGFIKDIHTSSTNLFEIINTLLNWSISQNGMISYQPREFTIGGLCQTSISKLQSIAKLKDVSLMNQADNELTVFADDNMIMTIIHNLICNAIKFSHRGGEILLSAEVKDGMAEISITDSGVGISSENQAKLFRYDQIYRSKGTSGETGTGIGLILCKDFIERNNGRIWVESEVNKGSSFKFTLPLVK